MLPPALGLQQVSGEPSGASRMQENVIAAGAVRRTLLGSIQRSPDPLLAGVEEAGCPLPKNTTPAVGPWTSGFAFDTEYGAWSFAT